MDKKNLREIKKKLLEEKTNLESELEKIAKKNPHNPDNYDAQFEDYGSEQEDNTSEVVEFSLNLSLEKTLEKSLKDVKQALDSIAKNKYGICKYCKQPIDEKRLKARPTSSACISCKTKLKAM